MTASDKTVLALDAHGGDRGLDVSVPGTLAALQADKALSIVLVGNSNEIQQALDQHGPGSDIGSRLSVHHADSVIAMDAKPAAVLRRGRDSSMWKAFELVAEHRADACISGGNTAAMMVTGVKLLGMLRGIQRPALMAYVPNMNGFTGLLDLGANLNVSADQLVQFAVMGSVTTQLAEGVENPRVGLLNVGHEDSKGHNLVKDAHDRLQDLPINYAGFIEGNDIYAGTVDVAVCDGFAGNLILKSGEGLARMLMHQFKGAFNESARAKAGATMAGPSLRRMLARLDPSAHNGAPLLGLNRVAVKSHGGSDLKGTTRAILEASREARRQVPRKIEASIHEYHLEMSA